MSNFTVDLAKFGEKALGNVDKVVRQTLQLAHQGLDAMAPVDLGRFRGNWNVSEGTPDLTTTEALDPTGSATRARIMAQIQGYKAGTVHYLANGLPYAYKLEMGHSSQAPNGTVRITAMDLPRRVEEYAAKLK